MEHMHDVPKRDEIRANRFGWHRWLIWILVNVSGSVLGLITAVSAIAVIHYVGIVVPALSISILVMVYCGMVAFMQWLVIRHYVRSQWALFTAMGSLITTFVAIGTDQISGLYGSLLPVALSGFIYSGITGVLALIGVAPRRDRLLPSTRRISSAESEPSSQV